MTPVALTVNNNHERQQKNNSRFGLDRSRMNGRRFILLTFSLLLLHGLITVMIPSMLDSTTKLRCIPQRNNSTTTSYCISNHQTLHEETTFLKQLTSQIEENNNSTTAMTASSSSSSTRTITNHTSIMYDKCNNTIVTAFFLLDTTKRHTDEKYFENMKRLFSNDDAMIIFTSPELVVKLMDMRSSYKNRTVVVPLQIHETKAAQMFNRTFWDQASAKSKKVPHFNGGGLQIELYHIWNSKADFLKRGSDLNPFESTFFAWVDAGYIRWDGTHTHGTILQRIPPELSLEQTMTLDVTPVLKHQRIHQMAGGFFGGYKPGVDLFFKRYYETLDDIGNSPDIYYQIANDQMILHHTCTRHPGLCFVVNARRKVRHPILKECVRHAYFYMLPFLNTEMYNVLERELLINKTGWPNMPANYQYIVENGNAIPYE